MNRKLVVLTSIVFLLLPILQFFGVTRAGLTDNMVSTISSTVGYTYYPWPMFRHDSRHTGYTSSPGPVTNQTLWIYETPYDIWGPSPVVANNILYIGGGWGPLLYAINASTGTLMWNYTTWAWIASTPAVAYGMVYFGAYNDNVTALDAFTGELLWNHTFFPESPGHLSATSPAVVDGVVYIGGGFGNQIFALNAYTGELIWNYTTGGEVHSSPAVANGVVYVGSYDDNVYALNAATGDLMWNYTTGSGVYSSPAVADGVVYVGSNDDNMYALNASTGVLMWNFTTGGWVASSPAVVDGVVYVGSYDNYLYALNATTGAKIWSYPTGGAISSSPAIAGDIVYVGTGIPANKTYALNATTGTKIWSYKTGGDVWGSPAVVDGVVYTSSRDGKIYAIGYDPSPRASFTYQPESPFVGETVTFNATDSYDLYGTIVSYDWNFGDSTTGSGMVVTHNYSAFGTYNATLRVTDNDGLNDTEWKTVKVGGFPVAEFTYSPVSPFVGETVTFNATDSYDRDGYIVGFDWSFGDDANGTGMITTHKYTAASTFIVSLTVTDNDTLTDTTTQSITIAKVDSTVTIDASPKNITVGENTTISGSITPTRADVTVTIHHSLDGGTWTTLANVNTDSAGGYSYTWTPDEAGTYEVKASWQGDANTLEAESSTVEIAVEEVTAQRPDYLLPVAVAVIGIAVVAAIATYFLKVRKTARIE